MIAIPWPAIVTLPERGLVLGLDATVTWTGPAVVPLLGDTVIQVESFDADQVPPVQSVGVEPTLKIFDPPVAGNCDAEAGVTE